MANTLTGLIPTIYDALNVVSRELVGFIPAVSRDAQAAQAAVNQTVRSPIVPAMTAVDIVPAAVSSSGADRSLSYVDLTLTKQRKVSFHLTGEQEVSLGPNNGTVARDSFAQAFRTLANEMEADLASLYYGASRAYGTAGTTPFGTAGDLSDFAQVQNLDDNGAPLTGRQLVMGTTAMANIRGKQSVLFKFNEANTDELLRDGSVARVEGLDLHTSAQVKSVVKGTGSGYLINGAHAVGATTVNVNTGTGTILAGDVVTIAGDSNKYVVTSALAAGAFTIAGPGLLVAQSGGQAVTVGNNYVANMAFSRDAFVLATRTPAVPSSGDVADDRTVVQDPVSRLAFEASLYRQYRQISFEVGIVWGFQAVKPTHAALLLG